MQGGDVIFRKRTGCFFSVPCGIALLAITGFCWSADTVMVKGLFTNAALLVIDGEQVLLKKGGSQSGVTLIEASSRDVLLEINGQRQRVGLSRQVGGHYQPTQKRRVRIASQDGGHHRVRGEVNGHRVDFVVDTGATVIALNYSTAKRIGIDLTRGARGYSSTANGVKEIRLVTLDKVSIGAITQYNVQASVSLDDALPVALLGNSFLSRTNLRTENGVLVLETK